MNILISACLLDLPCRYDGKGALVSILLKGISHCRLLPVCPEQLGGLPTPRPPAERVGDRIYTQQGEDVTAAYMRGADSTCVIASMFACTHAILKSKSPSCGCGCIYDGSFAGKLIQGDGITTQKLRSIGLKVADEHTFRQWGLSWYE